MYIKCQHYKIKKIIDVVIIKLEKDFEVRSNMEVQ